MFHQEPDRLQWGAGRIVHHENLYDLVEGLLEKYRRGETEVREEILRLEAVEKRQQAYLKDTERYDIKNVSYAVRVAQELGIDIIKTYWTGSADTFAKAVELGAPAKVVISGGPRCATLRACFEMTKSGMDAGAAGITYGRNIWQHPYPDAVVAGLQEIVHNGATVDQAMEAAETLSGCHLE